MRKVQLGFGFATVPGICLCHFLGCHRLVVTLFGLIEVKLLIAKRLTWV